MTSTASAAGMPLLGAIEGEEHLWVDTDEGRGGQVVLSRFAFLAIATVHLNP